LDRAGPLAYRPAVHFLALSLLPLALGPLLVAWARRARWTAVSLDAFVIVTVGGMVLLHILPESVERGGLLALGAFAIGLLAPVLAEHGWAPTGRRTRVLALTVALLALMFHAMVDGMWLRGGVVHDHEHLPGEPHDHEHGNGALLAWAVLLHRLLEGLAVWWVVPRTLGVAVAVLTTLLLAGGTVIGFVLSSALIDHAPATVIGLFEALLCGSLAHVVVHAHIPPPRDSEGRGLHVASLLGGLAGALTYALTAVEGHGHEHGVHAHGEGPGQVFLGLALQSAPALVLGYLAVGLSQSFLPADWARRFLGGGAVRQAVRGVAVGLPLPVCSCGVLPIYRDLVRKGASLAGALAFLVATPELEIAAILLSFRLLGPEVTILRVAAAGVLALGTALLVHRIAGRRAAPQPEIPPDHQPARRRSLVEVLRYGFVDAVEDTGSWLLAGLGIAAVLTPHLDPSMLHALPPGLEVPIAALLGMPLYVCASGSTPLAAVLVAHGVSPGAAVAFLLTGPATNITTYGVLTRLHGHAVSLTFLLVMVMLSVALGYAVDAVLPAQALAVPLDAHHHAGTWLEIACLVVLAAALLLFFLRVGVRGALARLFMAHADQHDGHHHHHAGTPAHDQAVACCHDH